MSIVEDQQDTAASVNTDEADRFKEGKVVPVLQ
jgi:hypothetical protein